ncbi:MAG: hypothetical protein V2A79_00710 [Planctomycetota bacterium]
MERLRRVINIGIALGVLLLAVVGMRWLVATKPRPERLAAAPVVPQVEVLAVQPVVFDAPIVGYGTVRPKRQIKIVPEVGGRLVKVHGGLAPGNLIAKDELLFEIDPQTYQLRVEQAQAEVRRLEAELERRRREQSSLEKRLAVAQKLLDLADQNLARERSLADEQAARTVDVEKAEEAYLRQKDVVLGYQSQLDLMPSVIADTEAALHLKRSQLAEAQRQVEKTKITCPFDARVESVSAAESQVVVASFTIATLTDMEALELAAGVDPRDLRWTNLRAFARAVGQDLGTPPEAAVTWSLYDQGYAWRGAVTRLERLDETSRTARVIVEIRDVMQGLQLESGQASPPVSIGMFCRVAIPAEPLPNALVIPRSAVYDGDGGDAAKFVYVFEPDGDRPGASDGRLGIRRVPLLRMVGDQVLVDFDGYSAALGGPDESSVCELRAGDEIVVSPLPRAVIGMPLRRRAERSVARSEARLEACATNTPRPRDLLASLHFPDPPTGPNLRGSEALPGDF